MAEPRKDFDDADIQTWFEEQEEEEVAGAEAPEESLQQKYARSQLRVVRETKDYTLDYLRHALAPGTKLIDISPSYQRRLRWSRKKRSLLIESFLLNIPIPPVFLYERDYNEYEVIDGRQRLQAVSEFLSNNYSLTGLHYWPELNGERFNDLPGVIQKGLLRRSLPAVVLLAETVTPDKDEVDVRTVLFDRLNTGGEKLNPQELRNALCPGAFNDMLIRAARTSVFTQTWNIPPYTEGEEKEIPEELEKNTLFRTMADSELVLRFFAIRDAIVADRKGSLRRILDRFMKEHARDSESLAKQFEREFIDVLTVLYKTFDGEPFRLLKTDRPSRPLYDALTVALSLEQGYDPLTNKQGVQKSLERALLNQTQYDVLVGRGNTILAVRDRVELARRILRGAN